MAQQFILSNQQDFDTNGNPLAGAKLYFVEAGTVTPLTTYSDNDLTIPNSDPVVADSSGRFDSIYLAVDDYGIQLTDANDVTIWTDPLYSVQAGLAAGAGLSTDSSNVLALAKDINAQTGTSYAILDTDHAKQVTLANSNAISLSIAQAGAASQFDDMWFTDIYNSGVGLATLTPTTSTVNGAATLLIPRGMNARLISDGSNYTAILSRSIPVYPNVSELTIASGAITITGSAHTIDTEGDAATDNLDTISGGANGEEVTFSVANASRLTTFRSGVGNIVLPNSTNISFTGVNDRITFVYDGTNWLLKHKNFTNGVVIQQVVKSSATKLSTAITIPYDTSIPQSSEGVEFFTQAFTPRSAASRILYEVSTFAGNSNTGNLVTFALFKDSTANSFAAGATHDNGTSLRSLSFAFDEASPGVSSYTVKLRYGPNANTGYINQQNTGVDLGNLLTTVLKITEYI